MAMIIAHSRGEVRCSAGAGQSVLVSAAHADISMSSHQPWTPYGSAGPHRPVCGSQGSLVGLYRSERRASLRTHRRCTSCPGHTARRSDSWRGVRAVRRMHAGAMRLKLRGDSAGEVQGGRNTKARRAASR